MKLHLNKVLMLAVMACLGGASTAWADAYTAPTTPTTSTQWTQDAASGLSTPANWTNGLTTAGQWLMFNTEGTLRFGVGDKLTQELVGDENNARGIWVSNGADVTMTAGAWMGDLVVDSGSSLNMTMPVIQVDNGYGNLVDQQTAIKTAKNHGNTATVYVAGNLTINNIGMCRPGKWAAQNQQWLITETGSLTLDFDGDRDGITYLGGDPVASNTWTIQKKTNLDLVKNRTGIADSLETVATVITSNKAIDNYPTIVVFDKAGNDITSQLAVDRSLGVVAKYYTSFEAANLKWAGSATWGDHATGWHTVDADGANEGTVDTTFLNGDSVTFGSTAAASTVTVAAAGVEVNNMTVKGDYTFTGGTLGVTGTLKIQDGGKVDVTNLSMADSGYIAVKNGELDLNGNTSFTRAEAHKITLGDSTNKGSVKIAAGKTLDYDNLTFTGKAAGAEISSTANKELSLYWEGVTFKNVDIKINGEGAREINAALDGVSLDVSANKATAKLKNGQTLDSLTVAAGATAMPDNCSATVSGDALVEGKVTVEGADASLALKGTTTLKGDAKTAQIYSKAVTITAKDTQARSAGTATLKNVTLSNSGIAGESATKHGSISDGAVTLKNSAKVSNVDFENTDINLADLTEITMQDVVFGAGTTLSGDATVTASGSNTVVLTETAVIADNVTFDPTNAEAGVTLTYLGLDQVGFAADSTLNLELTHDFIVELQKLVMPEHTQKLTINFGDGKDLTGVNLGTIKAGYLAVENKSIDGSSVVIAFAKFDAIPEPATATLALLALAGLASRRRRKH